jgi:hypothetical protein
MQKDLNAFLKGFSGKKFPIDQALSIKNGCYVTPDQKLRHPERRTAHRRGKKEVVPETIKRTVPYDSFA